MNPAIISQTTFPIAMIEMSTVLLANAGTPLIWATGRLWGMVAMAFIVTIVFEWPFVVGCLWGTKSVLLRSCSASLMVQSFSYALLIGWYGLASVQSLFTEVTLVPPEEMSLPAGIRVYYISDDDGDVYSRDLGTGLIRREFDLNSHGVEDCLSFENDNRDFQTIVAISDSQVFHPTVVDIRIIIRDADCPQEQFGQTANEHRPMTRMCFPGPSLGIAPRLGSAIDSQWTFTAGYWAAQGLLCENIEAGESFRFGLEAPFASWAVRHAIELPSGYVLFQLGTRQICILKTDTRTIAVLCHGRGAIAVLKADADQEQTSGECGESENGR